MFDQIDMMKVVNKDEVRLNETVCLKVNPTLASALWDMVLVHYGYREEKNWENWEASRNDIPVKSAIKLGVDLNWLYKGEGDYSCAWCEDEGSV